ncbi:hypothetical protein K439DRAFT_1639160 [Ramaria rubella]|nr:hypothetical protein K439DRAFT_1639160 [Ramaria rubella]
MPDELVHYSCSEWETSCRSRMVSLLNILFNILYTYESIFSLFHFEGVTEIHETRCRSSVYAQFHSAPIPSRETKGDRNGR